MLQAVSDSMQVDSPAYTIVDSRIYKINSAELKREMYGYALPMHDYGIKYTYVLWCKDHIKNPCAYWFENDVPTIGFTNYDDMIWFILSNIEK